MGLIETIKRNMQLVLLIQGLFPGILAAFKIISGAQATLVLMILFILSRRFAKAQQNEFELDEAARVAQEHSLATQAQKKGKGKGKSEGKDD